MVGLRRGDEGILTFDVRGTAFDCSADGEYIIVAGFQSLNVVSLGNPTTSWSRLRTNRELVKQVRFHPIHNNLFSCISGQYVDVFELSKGSIVQKLVSFPAHSRKISDFNWCPHSDNLMVCCAEHDTISFWDLRDTMKPCLELALVFGASQAKFSPFYNNLILSTHGCDIRLWDLRHTLQPINQFTGHEFRIQCLLWHPQEKNSFVSSAIDGLLKVWDISDQKSVPNVLNVGSVNAWRLAYSPDGDELASISVPTDAEGLNCVNIFTNSSMDNPQTLRNDNNDIIMDICWQKQVQKLTKYVYTLSKKSRLCRHPVSYELINEARDEMATPIAQSAVDEERDRLIAEHADEAAAAAAAVIASFEESSEILFDKNNDNEGKKFSYSNRQSALNTNKYLSNSQLNSTFGSASLSASGKPLKPLGFIASDFDGSHKFGTQQINNGGTSQSPIVSEWSRWITAPNKTGGDLLTELEAIRKPLIEGMYTTEVNFQRAAIGFSYMHLNKCRKINFEMRFHKYFIDNGLVFVEVLQKDSPLTPDKATLFLTLLQQESDEQSKVESESTILSRVFLQLPKLVESMKIFTPSIDVPNALKTTNSSLSGSYNDDHATTADVPGDECSDIAMPSLLKPTAIIPVTYTPSPYDHFVPAPRNCGGRFNGSGFLVTFGRVNYGFSSTRVPRISKASIGELPTTATTVTSVQQQIDKQLPVTDYSIAINTYRRRSFQQHNFTSSSKKSNEPLHSLIMSSSATKKEDINNQICNHRQYHQYPSCSSEIPRVITNYSTTNNSQVMKGSSRQRSSNKVCGSSGILSRRILAGNTTEHINQVHQKHHNIGSRYSHSRNPRSLADYCISVFVPQESTTAYATNDILTAKKALVDPIPIASNGALPEISSLVSESSSTTKCCSKHDDDNNRFSIGNSCSTSPTSNLFSSSTNTVIALALPQISHTMPGASPDSTQPFPISAALQRNNSIKSITKVLSSSPKPCGVCTSTGATRSFSLQNVSQSSRRRGNSMTIMGTANGSVNAVTGAVVGSSGGSVPNPAPSMVMEEHAVMPESSFSSTVNVYDTLGLLPFSKELASKYKLLGGSALDLCRHNLKQTQDSCRQDLVRVWKMLEQCIISSYNGSSSNNSSTQLSINRIPWALHPLGRNLINSLLDHYNQAFDIQTAAIITCILGNRQRQALYRNCNTFDTAEIQYSSHVRYKMSVAGQQLSFVAANNPDQSNLFGSSVHSRSLSASLAPPSPNNQVQTGLKTIQNQGYHQLSYRERNAYLSNNSENATSSSNFSKLARSSSFENENQSLDESNTNSNAVLQLTGGNLAGPPSRKPSSSFGFAPVLQFPGITRKVDSIQDCTVAVVTTASAALSTTASVIFKNTTSSNTFNQQTETHKRNLRGKKSIVCGYVSNYLRNYSNGGNDAESNLLLDPVLMHRFEDIRLQYADILYRWGMFIKCAEVMKYCSTPMTNSTVVPAPTVSSACRPIDDEVIGLITEISWCASCDECLRHTFKCSSCKRPPIICAVCENPCYGTIVTCTSCSHGGHLSHIASWFETQSSCPLSCGCECRI